MTEHLGLGALEAIVEIDRGAARGAAGASIARSPGGRGLDGARVRRDGGAAGAQGGSPSAGPAPEMLAMAAMPGTSHARR